MAASSSAAMGMLEAANAVMLRCTAVFPLSDTPWKASVPETLKF
jgi:hypothetical protein